MRRQDKAVTDARDIIAIIKEATVCRLGMVDGDRPYIVPLNFGYQDNTFYFHGAVKGRKIDLIKKNPNVCVELDSAVEVLRDDQACDWSMKFHSVIGFGKAALIERVQNKRIALDIIMAHYSDKKFEFSEEKVKSTAVIKVDIDHMTGKQSGF